MGEGKKKCRCTNMSVVDGGDWFETTSVGYHSIQEQSCLCILDHPGQAFFQVDARHGTAPQNVPPMCADLLEFEGLAREVSVNIYFVYPNGREMTTGPAKP